MIEVVPKSRGSGPRELREHISNGPQACILDGTARFLIIRRTNPNR